MKKKKYQNSESGQLVFPFIENFTDAEIRKLKKKPASAVGYQGRVKNVLPSIGCTTVYDVLSLKWDVIHDIRRFGPTRKKELVETMVEWLKSNHYLPETYSEDLLCLSAKDRCSQPVDSASPFTFSFGPFCEMSYSPEKQKVSLDFDLSKLKEFEINCTSDNILQDMNGLIKKLNAHPV